MKASPSCLRLALTLVDRVLAAHRSGSALLGADQLKAVSPIKTARTIDELVISVSGASESLSAALAAGQIIGEAANLARDISVEPPNVLTPLALVDRARAMAKANGLTFRR